MEGWTVVYLKCNFFSKVLLNHVDVDILLPCMGDNACVNRPLEEIYAPEPPCPVLYLLHGALDDHTMWLRNTAIERYAESGGLAVVMPSGQNGFYTDAKAGPAYFTFLSQELPRFVEKNFPVSSRREDRYIAGPSMGGYGASKCALRCPDRYAAFGDLSGAVDPETLYPRMVAMGFDIVRYDLIFGGADKVAGSQEDVYALARQGEKAGVKPKAYVYCGLEDTANYDMNRRFYDALVQSGFQARFTDGHGGHDWEYWDRCIQDFLRQIAEDRKTR